MLIHSVMMIDALLPPQEAAQTRLFPLKSGWIEGREQNGQLTIQRLISTDPADYLRPDYMPGMSLSINKNENHSEQ